MKNIIIISWKSGSGKSTLVEKFLEESKNFIKFPNFTTRDKRNNSDNDYFFISKKDFLIKRKNKEIINSRKSLDKNDWYWLWNPLDENYISILSPEWVEFLEEYCEKYKLKLLSIFLDVDENILSNRLQLRWESIDFINQRLSSEKDWENYWKLICKTVLDWNDSIETVYEKFKDIINNL